jgi:hypothetical protein
MPGYSSTPLWKKLGYKTEMKAFVDRGPETYREQLGLPKEVRIKWLSRAEDGVEFVHVFAKKAAELGRKLTALRSQVAQDAVVWVSWPKKASRVETDITDNTIRELALPLGFVDIKVCAVDDVWSGLKLMIRKTERRSS